MRWQEGHFHNIIKSWPINWKIIVSQGFSYSRTYVRLPSPGVWHWKEEPQSIWLWRPAGLECRSSTGLGETSRLYSWRAYTRIHMHWDPGQSSDSIEAWARPTCVSWRVSWGGGGSAVVHWGDKDTCGRGPREYILMWALLEVGILAPRPGPTQQPAGSSGGTPKAKQPKWWE